MMEYLSQTKLIKSEVLKCATQGGGKKGITPEECDEKIEELREEVEDVQKDVEQLKPHSLHFMD